MWARVCSLLPGRVGTPGARAKNNRRFVEGVIWILRTGAPWRDLPAFFGKWNTVFKRFRRWSIRGVWQVIYVNLYTTFRRSRRALFIDSTYVRVHQHASGAPGGPLANAIGISRGGRTCKLHVAVGEDMLLQSYALTAGQVADITVAPVLLAHVSSTAFLVADRGYDCDSFVHMIQARGIRPVIRPRRHRRVRRPYSKKWYRERNRVERFFCMAKHRRRLATRFDKTPISFVGFLFVQQLLCAAKLRNLGNLRKNAGTPPGTCVHPIHALHLLLPTVAAHP
jgi:transposase